MDSSSSTSLHLLFNLRTSSIAESTKSWVEDVEFYVLYAVLEPSLMPYDILCQSSP